MRSWFSQRCDQIRGAIQCFLSCYLSENRSGIVQRVKDMFGSQSRPTWITVEPLTFSAVSLLVSKTLHRSIDDCVPLSRFVFAASSGNAFSARSILTTLQRQSHVISPVIFSLLSLIQICQIVFNWEHNHWCGYPVSEIGNHLTIP